MRSISTFSFLSMLVLFSLLITNQGCEKDSSTPPETNDFVINDSDWIGVRLSIDSIECVTPGGDDSFELYGYIRSWADYSGREPMEYEKEDVSLMWYRQPEDWYRMKVNSILVLNKTTDHFFNSDHKGSISLNLAIGLFEFDKADGKYFHDEVGSENILRYSENINAGGNVEYQEMDMPIKYLVEDIEFYDPLYETRYETVLFNGSGKSQFILHYSYHQIFLRSDALLPEGKKAGEEFIEEYLYPDIPKSESYAGRPPSNSEAIAIGQKTTSKFSPKPLMLKGDYHSGWGNPYREYDVYDIYPKYISGKDLIPPSFNSNQNEQHTTKNPWSGLVWFTGSDPDNKPSIYIVDNELIGPELTSKPIIQMVRYWVLTDLKRIPAGTSLSHEISITHGFSRNITNSTAVTLGFESGFFAANFSAEISHTFSISLNYDYSETETSTIEISAPSDKNVQYVTWQLYEEFRIVNENGNIFTDDNYDFNSMTGMTIPTNHTVQEAFHFDAN